jgi:hypothetical protein
LIKTDWNSSIPGLCRLQTRSNTIFSIFSMSPFTS